MRLDHRIFQGPLVVDMQLEPSDNPKYPGQTWLVHEGEFSRDGKGVDVGMVSNGYGFEDSPDCERISGGINTKGPRAVAIGREANLMSWGFYGAPDRMTPSARAAFLNAIVYMRRFDGQRPLVRSVAQSREMMSWSLDFVRELDGMEAGRRKSMEAHLQTCFPADVLAANGLDAAKLTAWYEANVEFLRNGDDMRGHVIDEDVRKLGVSNRKKELFPRLIGLLRDDPRSELAHRLIARYLPPGAPQTAEALSRWVAEFDSKLFFSDVGGFRWFVDNRPPLAVEATAPLK